MGHTDTGCTIVTNAAVNMAMKVTGIQIDTERNNTERR